MTHVVWLMLGVLALFAAEAWLAIWSRRDTWGRLLTVLLFIVGLPAIAIVAVESLGWHKPLALVWDFQPGEHRVLAAKLVQDEAIYLYIDDPIRSEPRPIILPWSNDMANRIQKLQDEANPDANGQFIMRYEPSLDTHAPQFHPLPQPPALPPKRNPPVQRFDQA
ncbi:MULTISPECIES: hypothetical protein [unclassified Ensifer]|uniref:hypothetical protein n=1 Tax=unclassified Ensifer TaxID=2633371 RepID=UPI0008134DFC|nr:MULTISPECIES: hypothetical protein [unclassified Ensifer]OCP19376.1 hypothetical protein BC361_31105 [Ensifer sp. LC54]OCP19498.1 hypothetical protein BC363_31020 [Ensifer sp. LC384]